MLASPARKADPGAKVLPVVRLWPLRCTGERDPVEVAREASDIADRGQDHGKDKYLHEVLGGVTVDCGFAKGDGLCVLCDGEGFLSGHQRLVAHQPTQRIQAGGGSNSGETQYVGVGHMVMAG